MDKQFDLWNEIKEFVFQNKPDAFDEWNYSKFGWNYRIKDKNRIIIYFMPLDKYFRVSLVFGKKATEEALNRNISKEIKKIISSAKVYAEGRGFRIDIKDKKIVKDIKKLIQIKLLY